MTARVALLLVSHSADLARGAAELAGQMAPDVLVRGVGGGPDGGLGTSLDAVQKELGRSWPPWPRGRWRRGRRTAASSSSVISGRRC
nr:hypothetical protein GCM10025730_14250 [Promicromonospora thailandica]